MKKIEAFGLAFFCGWNLAVVIQMFWAMFVSMLNNWAPQIMDFNALQKILPWMPFGEGWTELICLGITLLLWIVVISTIAIQAFQKKEVKKNAKKRNIKTH